MKLYELLNANEPLKRLTEKHFINFKVIRELVNLRKKVDSEVDFYVGEERKIVETYAIKDENGNPIFIDGGRVKLGTIEDKINFETEINKLKNLDIEIDKVILNINDFKSTDDIPTPNDILTLDKLVEFKE